MVSIPFIKKKQEEPKSYSEMTVAEKLEHLKLGAQEKGEEFWHKIDTTSYPQPEKRFRFVLKEPKKNAQALMNFFVHRLKGNHGFNNQKKVIDSMGLSVGSSMFGNFAARLSAQQNQASQYLKGISEMVKGMFQIVREVRIIDERLQFYYDSDSENSKLAQSSEIVLKGLWVDQVEGGSKNPSSVYGLANTVGFTILPDVFFRTKPLSKSKIEKTVNAMRFNEKVKEILKRKLRQYYEWKERTKEELETRRKFVVKYLRQHYATIKLYMSWVTPYLRNIKRLQKVDKMSDSINVLNAFEQSLFEAESVSWRTGYGKYNAVVIFNAWIKVSPELSFHHQEYQNKGAIHIGLVKVNLRAYAWTEKQIKNYIKYRNEEDLDLMKEIDSSISEAMDALGDDLKKYLKDAGESFPDMDTKKKEEKKVRPPTIFEPFAGVVGGFKEVFETMIPKKFLSGGKKAKKEKPTHKDHINKERAADFAKLSISTVYQRFKELYSMLYW
ncbi:hypothetical protein GF327_08930 [Candidatus Woesearchaeota archaeon]|nr:hypothetical protein [Candidatus Woesearchaeota archaeon]